MYIAEPCGSTSGGMKSPEQDEAIHFLGSRECHADTTREVAVIETHHAWVFLTDRNAYKMKKPYRYGQTDCSSLASRRFLCEEEYRLNRRLAADTYLGVIPLARDRDGRLHLGGAGHPVEWLVHMRRLPQERMLDRAGVRGDVTADDIDRLMRKLLRFYDSAPRCHVGGGSYASRLRQDIAGIASESEDSRFALPQTLLRPMFDSLVRYARNKKDLLESRQHGGFVREVHGDLRPEHVCLLQGVDPEIVDCLEFEADLRCQDCVEELAYFGLECRMLGLRWIEQSVVNQYRSSVPDTAPDHLWRFYAARRALLRAVLSARHVLDYEDATHWHQLGRSYVALAMEYIEQKNET